MAGGGWVINEFLADPSNDVLSGDANGDGKRDASEDEFVEILNLTGAAVDISGWTLSDGIGVRHIFEAGTLVADSASIVVFGGGTPTKSFGSSLVQVASSGALALNNSGDAITLKAGTSTVTSVSYGAEGGQDEALTREPQITGTFVRHSLATGASGAAFSPGTLANGERFSGNPLVWPTQLKLIINGGADVYAKKSFGVLVISVDSSGRAQAVSENTVVKLALTSGDPAKLTGARSGLISAGASKVRISNLKYSVAENNLEFLAVQTSGHSLASDSSLFHVQARSHHPLPGELVISEFMANPDFVTDDIGEYFELYNPTDSSFNLDGYQIMDDGSDAHIIENGGTLNILPHGFLLFARSQDPVGDGSLTPDYVFKNFTISNGADEIVIAQPAALGGKELARANYTDGDAFGAGVALELMAIAAALDGLIWQSDFSAATFALSEKNTDKGSPFFYGTSKTQTLTSGEAVSFGVGLVNDTMPMFSIRDDNDAAPSVISSYKIFSDSLHHKFSETDRAILGFVQVSGSPDSATITMHYTDAQFFSAGFANPAESALQLAAWNGNSWQKYPRAAGSDTVQNKVVAENVMSFSDWAIIGGNEDSPLPVALAAFTGVQSELGVALNWQTASETNHAGFVLYRNEKEIATYQNNDALKAHGTRSNGATYHFLDSDIFLGETYTYTLTSIDISGTRHAYSKTVTLAIIDELEHEAEKNAYQYALSQNYPNPFNLATVIQFSLLKAGIARLKIFDMLGREILSEEITGKAGWNMYRFNASHLSSGVYFYQVQSGTFSDTRKMLLLK